MIKKNFYFLVIIVFINFFFLPVKSDTIFELGKDIFLNKAVCSTCHTLSDAGSNSQIGPNLNEIKDQVKKDIQYDKSIDLIYDLANLRMDHLKL